MSQQQESERTPGLFQAMASAVAAAFGVQSDRNRERDFKHGKARNFIIAGVLFTVLFILAIVVIVKLVLRQAGM